MSRRRNTTDRAPGRSSTSDSYRAFEPDNHGYTYIFPPDASSSRTTSPRDYVPLERPRPPPPQNPPPSSKPGVPLESPYTSWTQSTSGPTQSRSTRSHPGPSQHSHSHSHSSSIPSPTNPVAPRQGVPLNLGVSWTQQHPTRIIIRNGEVVGVQQSFSAGFSSSGTGGVPLDPFLPPLFGGMPAFDNVLRGMPAWMQSEWARMHARTSTRASDPFERFGFSSSFGFGFEFDSGSGRQDRSGGGGRPEPRRRREYSEPPAPEPRPPTPEEPVDIPALWASYTSAWANLTSPTAPAKLSRSDIPWPLPIPESKLGHLSYLKNRITPGAIAKFILSKEHSAGVANRKRIHDALRLYHPDRFEGLVVMKVKERYREDVRLLGKDVAQGLSALLEKEN